MGIEDVRKGTEEEGQMSNSKRLILTLKEEIAGSEEVQAALMAKFKISREELLAMNPLDFIDFGDVEVDQWIAEVSAEINADRWRIEGELARLSSQIERDVCLAESGKDKIK